MQYSHDPEASTGGRALDAAAYRLMSSSDAFFSRKNYNEAYIGYTAVLDSFPHSRKAAFRMTVSSQYLMCETSAVYLSSDAFYRKANEMLAAETEKNSDLKLILLMCKDLLDFIIFNAEYERKFALSHKNKNAAVMYMKNMLGLMEKVYFIMKCVICANDKDSAFTAMKCYETGKELFERICKGMEYYGDPQSGGDGSFVLEPSADERSEAEHIYSELTEIRQSILKNADDELYSKLMAREKNDETENTDPGSEDLRREEYEYWRRNNEKAYASADRANVIFGIISKMFFVFAAVFAAIFAFEAVVRDEVIGMIAVFIVVFALAGVLFSALENNSENKRKFYAKLVYGGVEQFQAEQKDINNIAKL